MAVRPVLVSQETLLQQMVATLSFLCYIFAYKNLCEFLGVIPCLTLNCLNPEL